MRNAANKALSVRRQLHKNIRMLIFRNFSRKRLLAIAGLAFYSNHVMAASTAERLATALDGNCIQNSEDFTAIDRYAQLAGWKDFTKEMRQADAAVNKLGGRAYKANENGFKFLVSYAVGGGCSILAPEIDADNLIKVLKKNFRFTKTLTDDAGMQITRTFILAPSTNVPAGMIFVISPKPETGYKHGTVGFVPATSAALQR